MLVPSSGFVRCCTYVSDWNKQTCLFVHGTLGREVPVKRCWQLAGRQGTGIAASLLHHFKIESFWMSFESPLWISKWCDSRRPNSNDSNVLFLAMAAGLGILTSWRHLTWRYSRVERSSPTSNSPRFSAARVSSFCFHKIACQAFFSNSIQ